MKALNFEVLTLSILSFLASTITANADQPKNSGIKTEIICQKPLEIKGPGNRFSSLAELNTIIVWTNQVTKKYGKDHATWHKAKSKLVRCKKSTGSIYFYCQIKAAPCAIKPIASAKQDTSNPSKK